MLKQPNHVNYMDPMYTIHLCASHYLIYFNRASLNLVNSHSLYSLMHIARGVVDSFILFFLNQFIKNKLKENIEWSFTVFESSYLACLIKYRYQ